MEDNKVILYTTHCPLCRGVEMLLKQKKIDYAEVTDVEQIRAKGFLHVPVLEVGGDCYTGQDIYKYIKEMAGAN